MEEHALSIISKMKSQHMSLFPSSGRAITGWLYHPKWKQLEMASYPKLATEEDQYEDGQGNTYVSMDRGNEYPALCLARTVATAVV